MIDVDESQLSPGKLLLQGRLEAGLTQEQVAKDLYMTVSKVKALESDDYGRLTSDTFARGYIRAYANLLKLDVVKVLAAYERLVEEHSAASAVDVQTPKATTAEQPSASRGAWQFLAIIGAFFLGMWLISVWFFDNHLEPQEMRYVVPPPTNLPKIDEAKLEALRQQSQTSMAATSETGMSSAATVAKSQSSAKAQESVRSQGAAKSQTSEATSLAATNLAVSSQALDPSIVAREMLSKTEGAGSNGKKASLDEIVFSFRAECWLEVSDSRGDVLATELQAPGSQIRLVGQAPFDVKLGNAPAVDITLNGKKVDVIPLMGTNVLIMKIGNP